MNISTRQFLESFDKGEFDSADVHTQCKAGWYDWFCRDTSLVKKTKKLAVKVKQISYSKKVNIDNTYVFFKNNCPMSGSLYDAFSICDLSSGAVIYSVVPKSGHKVDTGAAEVWGHENNFLCPLVHGSWKDVLSFFEVR